MAALGDDPVPQCGCSSGCAIQVRGHDLLLRREHRLLGHSGYLAGLDRLVAEAIPGGAGDQPCAPSPFRLVIVLLSIDTSAGTSVAVVDLAGGILSEFGEA